MYKYVVFEIDGHKTPIIFSKLLAHSDVARFFHPNKPLSAGFVNVDWVAMGESVSLGIKADPGDTALIRRHMDI